MPIEMVTISSTHISAGISSLGAELQNVSTHDGRELLWDGDPAFWQGRAPILFPVIGMLEHGCYRLDGKSYPMPKHGFARDSGFEIVALATDAVTMRLIACDATRSIYPFEFQLDIQFLVTGATLSLTATITNLGGTTMPASFGFHPALRWPLPYGQARDNYCLRFEQEESAPIRRIDQNGLLLPEPQPSPVVGNTLVLHDELFLGDALIFDRLASRSVTYHAQAGPKLLVEFADFPTLGVWTKPGAGFICIEPWQGFSDPEGYAGDIRNKPGIIEIKPGESRQFAMHISLQD
jgi:galactose mutarotase-like enzyme